MNPTLGRLLRIAAELLVIAVVVAAAVTSSIYASESPYFDHPARGENAWRNFVIASIVLSALGTVAAWVLWLAWRLRAALDAQPDAPARLLALAVATLPDTRRDWGAAMTSELSTLTDHAARWRFAASSARAALFPPAVVRRPAAGWVGAAVGVLGVLACTAAAIYMRVAYAETADAVHAYLTVVLVVVLASCLALPLVAPQALTSSALARRAGTWLGLAGGAGLLLFSRTGGLEEGAVTFTLPMQLVTFVIGPVVVAAVAQSLAAALQSILWGFVFSSVTMFPVYIVESIRRYHAGGGLYLDGDAPLGSTIGTNLADAVSWLLLVVPSLLVPLGILSAALVTAMAHVIKRARNRPRVASS